MPIQGSLLLITVAGLTMAQPAEVIPAPFSGTRTATDSSAIVPPESCRVTLPPVRQFTPPLPYPALPPSDDRFWYGSEALWVMPKIDGMWRGQRTAAGYRDKLFVWRSGYDGRIEQQPKLTVKGKRLDAESSPFIISPATNAYYPSFGWAMLAGVDIPTPGCWQLSLSYGTSSLAFVVWVVE